ncbi:MAG TPA: hypothetical protein VFE25_05040 [Opitutaceae bacterium]|jgi:hypothetical protein|nr:hypothetical protein [Opitutaceae bacterium]
MKKTPRDWMLERNGDAQARLDGIRAAALMTERASVLDSLISVFTVQRRAWVALLLIWGLLATLRHATATHDPVPSVAPISIQYMESLANLSPDEAIPPLDHRS